jgi:hypothetical protein
MPAGIAGVAPSASDTPISKNGLLQASRGDPDQHPRRLVAFVLEGMRRADRHVCEHPRRRHDPLPVDRKRDLAFEDVEPVFLPAVDVWQTDAGKIRAAATTAAVFKNPGRVEA